MATSRGEFSSRFGFIMAAAGSAVGLGNIWGFPTQAASNGGGAFLLVYLVLAFCIAYPALMAELIIGRHAHANAVEALRSIARGPITRFDSVNSPVSSWPIRRDKVQLVTAAIPTPSDAG